MSITFPATFAGRCGNCGELFEVDAEIFYDETDAILGKECCGADGRDSVRGLEDEKVPVSRVMPRGRTAKDVCLRCFIVHTLTQTECE